MRADYSRIILIVKCAHAPSSSRRSTLRDPHSDPTPPTVAIQRDRQLHPSAPLRPNSSQPQRQQPHGSRRQKLTLDLAVRLCNTEVSTFKCGPPTRIHQQPIESLARVFNQNHLAIGPSAERSNSTATQAGARKHTIALGGIGGDAHSVGLIVLHHAFSLSDYHVYYLSTQNELKDFFQIAPFANVVIISTLDGHGRYYGSSAQKPRP